MYPFLFCCQFLFDYFCLFSAIAHYFVYFYHLKFPPAFWVLWDLWKADKGKVAGTNTVPVWNPEELRPGSDVTGAEKCSWVVDGGKRQVKSDVVYCRTIVELEWKPEEPHPERELLWCALMFKNKSRPRVEPWGTLCRKRSREECSETFERLKRLRKRRKSVMLSVRTRGR